MNNQIMDKQQKLFAEITAMRESGKIVRFLEDGDHAFMEVSEPLKVRKLSPDSPGVCGIVWDIFPEQTNYWRIFFIRKGDGIYSSPYSDEEIMVVWGNRVYAGKQFPQFDHRINSIFSNIPFKMASIALSEWHGEIDKSLKNCYERNGFRYVLHESATLIASLEGICDKLREEAGLNTDLYCGKYGFQDGEEAKQFFNM